VNARLVAVVDAGCRSSEVRVGGQAGP
jgi:hypothetical protein